MTYSIAAALQQAVFERLASDQALSALVGGAVHDAVPAGPLEGTYVSLGPEEVRDASDVTGRGAEHRFTVSVVSDTAGFQKAKSAAAAICDALVDAPLGLTRGNLVGLRFIRARALRVEKGRARRIDIVFRARVEDA